MTSYFRLLTSEDDCLHSDGYWGNLSGPSILRREEARRGRGGEGGKGRDLGGKIVRDIEYS